LEHINCEAKGQTLIMDGQAGGSARKKTKIEPEPEPEEEHARILLENELGLPFRHHDDGSKNSMPDLLSEDGNHVAEVITTVPPLIRETENSLKPMPLLALPHCVWVTVPYALLGGASKKARNNIKSEILQWTDNDRCKNHWPSHSLQDLTVGKDTMPFLPLSLPDSDFQALCVQDCQHSENEPHQINWTIVHEPIAVDPWELIDQALHRVDTHQHGGVPALAEKLGGYPNKHLVMYPFGPPGNVTAAMSSYKPPADLSRFLPRQLAAPLEDIHLWLPYRYESQGSVEGLHICTGRWERFATGLPKTDDLLSTRGLHYRT